MAQTHTCQEHKNHPLATPYYDVLSGERPVDGLCGLIIPGSAEAQSRGDVVCPRGQVPHPLIPGRCIKVDGKLYPAMLDIQCPQQSNLCAYPEDVPAEAPRRRRGSGKRQNACSYKKSRKSTGGKKKKCRTTPKKCRTTPKKSNKCPSKNVDAQGRRFYCDRRKYECTCHKDGNCLWHNGACQNANADIDTFASVPLSWSNKELTPLEFSELDALPHFNLAQHSSDLAMQSIYDAGDATCSPLNKEQCGAATADCAWFDELWDKGKYKKNICAPRSRYGGLVGYDVDDAVDMQGRQALCFSQDEMGACQNAEWDGKNVCTWDDGLCYATQYGSDTTGAMFGPERMQDAAVDEKVDLVDLFDDSFPLPSTEDFLLSHAAALDANGGVGAARAGLQNLRENGVETDQEALCCPGTWNTLFKDAKNATDTERTNVLSSRANATRAAGNAYRAAGMCPADMKCPTIGARARRA